MTPTETAAKDPENLAPAWHSAVLVAVILAVAVTGTILAHGSSGSVGAKVPAPSARILALYLPMIVVQWSLVLYTCWFGRARNALPSLLGVRWTSARRALADLGLAVAGWVAIEACEVAWASFGGAAARGAATNASMLPHTGLELAVWVILAVSAGFCEEVVYRGYLQVQLGALTRRTSAGIVLQAALFGIAHADQGAAGVVRLAIYGLGLGVLARWRRSLLPGIVCHVAIDLASGLLHAR